jgi:ABC-type glycerol-3-phosphate transport system permease component
MSPNRISRPLVHQAPLLREDATVEEAVKAIVESGLPALPVVDDRGDLAGIFGEREFMAALFPGYVGEVRSASFIPRSLDEAAEIDGCGPYRRFFFVVLPLTKPALVTTAVFSFIQVWNDYLIAYVLLRSPEKQTLGIWLASFTTNHGTEWGGVMAGSTLFAIPAVVFFLLVQRRVVSGLTAGAVKG